MINSNKLAEKIGRMSPKKQKVAIAEVTEDIQFINNTEIKAVEILTSLKSFCEKKDWEILDFKSNEILHIWTSQITKDFFLFINEIVGFHKLMNIVISQTYIPPYKISILIDFNKSYSRRLTHKLNQLEAEKEE